jgi:hypothetical protein
MASLVGPVASYTFTNIQANHTIAASFVLKTYTIVASAGAGGSISPNGSVVVNCGDNQTFTITPNTGYQIADAGGRWVGGRGRLVHVYQRDRQPHHRGELRAIPATIAAASTSTYICPTNPCVTLPVNITRAYNNAISGISVTFQLHRTSRSAREPAA